MWFRPLWRSRFESWPAMRSSPTLCLSPTAARRASVHRSTFLPARATASAAPWGPRSPMRATMRSAPAFRTTTARPDPRARTVCTAPWGRAPLRRSGPTRASVLPTLPWMPSRAHVFPVQRAHRRPLKVLAHAPVSLGSGVPTAISVGPVLRVPKEVSRTSLARDDAPVWMATIAALRMRTVSPVPRARRSMCLAMGPVCVAVDLFLPATFLMARASSALRMQWSLKIGRHACARQAAIQTRISSASSVLHAPLAHPRTGRAMRTVCAMSDGPGSHPRRHASHVPRTHIVTSTTPRVYRARLRLRHAS
eukprot:comp21488_c0_seq1/m.46818 comp21488_c0_seq1/g.46818  ORF comp21488_c0_seq1/g.46818 comp21488_c0_seq1/m.46818 type:complete len:308 (-) comp21488_c0_seq1:154-1077(-)